MDALDQATTVVRSRVVPSVNVPAAVSCCVVPKGMVGLLLPMLMEASTAIETANFPVPLVEPEVALMVAAPTALPVARPLLLMFRIPAGELAQVTDDVSSCVVPSVYVPVAVTCCEMPRGMLDLPLATAIDARAAEETVS